MIPVIPAPTRVDLIGQTAWSGSSLTLALPGPFAGIESAAQDVLSRTPLVVHDGEANHPGALAVVVHVGEVSGNPLPQGLSAAAQQPPDERYLLETAQGEVRITAATPVGAFRGLTTLAQVLETSVHDGVAHLPVARIADGPRYSWRGLSLDVVRHFFTVAQVHAVIDVLALYKLNVLHLHLSDNEAWRLEVPGRPELTRAAEPGNEGSYSAADYAAIVDYAARRFVTVVPEIDLPGHTAAAFRAHPDLINRADQSVVPWPAYALDPDQPAAWALVEEALAHLASLTPGRFLHLGCDEAWGMDPDAYGRFVREARERVRALGKEPITWQEGARAGAGPDDVVQHWISVDPDAMREQIAARMPGQEALAQFLAEHIAQADGDAALAAEAGARLILSPASVAYLDTPYSEPAATEHLEALRARLGHPTYPGATLEESFDWDPASQLDVDPSLVAGVEAAIWGETLTSEEDLQFLLLPRLPGVAEKGWSGPTAWPEYSVRLAAHGAIWSGRGYTWFERA